MRRNGNQRGPAEEQRSGHRVLVHIGMHKTASSWLQENVFGRPQTGFWTSAPDTMRAKQRAKAHTTSFYADDRGTFTDDEEFDGCQMREQLQLPDMPAGRCAILSNERMSGHPLSNGIDRAAICRRLKMVVPEARILIVIREQRSMILSNYIQYLNFGGPHGIDRYLRPVNDGRRPCLSLNFWKYDRLVQLYIDAFGADNVLVLPYELFVAEPAEFIDRIFMFVGLTPVRDLHFDLKSNARGEYFSYCGARLASPWLRSSCGNAYAPSLLGRRWGERAHKALRRGLNVVVPRALHLRTKRRLLDRIENITADTYCRSNTKTEKLTGLDLGRFGYKLGSDNAAALDRMGADA